MMAASICNFQDGHPHRSRDFRLAYFRLTYFRLTSDLLPVDLLPVDLLPVDPVLSSPPPHLLARLGFCPSYTTHICDLQIRDGFH